MNAADNDAAAAWPPELPDLPDAPREPNDWATTSVPAPPNDVPGRWQEMLSETERRRLLGDIARTALAIGQDLFGEYALSDLDLAPPPAADEAGSTSDDPCPRERLAFLQQAWPALTGALSRIEAAPLARTTTQLRSVPAARARRVGAPALLAALRRGDWLPPGEAGQAEQRRPAMVEETVAAPNLDTPPNQAVAACLSVWANDLSAIAALAGALGVPNVAAAARVLAGRVQAHRARAPWSGLGQKGITETVAQSVLRGQTVPPLYRFVGDTFRRYRYAFAFEWDNPLFTLPARESWLLYEYWTFFQVAVALRALGLRAVRADGWALNRSGLVFTLAKGPASRIRFAGPGGQRATLGYNILFPAGGTTGSGYHARSHAMRPDIVLQRGGDGRLLVFDAKFRAYAEAGRSLTDERANLPLVHDINQAHAYRDALRRGAARAVDACWLLYAGRHAHPNLPVIAYPPTTPERPYGDGEVGALLLRPSGIGADHLRSVIAAFLSAPSAS